MFTRLGVSRIHGIGVFAIRPIPAGIDIFANDDAEILWVDRAVARAASPAEQRLYHDFGIADGDVIGCPASFDMLTPGWYMNEPADGEMANVVAGDGYRMLAARDIAEGEELTVAYATFSVPRDA